MDGPLVSVILPTRNSEGTIGVCLRSIVEQTYRNIEVIVVDNYSTDGTREVAAAYGARVFMKGPERTAQRNYGAQNALGEYLLFVDADFDLCPLVVEECVARCGGTRGQALVIPERAVGQGFWARCKALEKECYIGDDTIEAARFFDRASFWGVSGYDECLVMAEDWDLHLRVQASGARIGRVDAVIHHHEGRARLSDTVRKKFYYGRTLHLYLNKHRDMARRQLVLLRPAFARNARRLARDPLHAAGMMFMKACEFGAGGAGYAYGRWRRC